MHRSSHKLFLTAFLLPLLPWATSCLAESADRNEPIRLEADQVLMDDAQQLSTFTGNVRLTQGTLLIRGDKIIVAQDKDGFKRATASGNTAEFRQKREGADGYVEGYGNSIEYDTRTESLDLHQNARLKRDQDEVSGEHISYNVKTEIFRVNGGNASPGTPPPQRVRAVLQPKRKEPAAVPSPATSTTPAQ
ncbi:MAG: lipopolysaccharide transport periplasmic protein LptA [Nitrosomonadales bacterium]|nr:lipopolysaccharide transport periplasmic protein LptA [Nitrosomonadales bacterium]